MKSAICQLDNWIEGLKEQGAWKKIKNNVKKMKKLIDNQDTFIYNNPCVTEVSRTK